MGLGACAVTLLALKAGLLPTVFPAEFASETGGDTGILPTFLLPLPLFALFTLFALGSGMAWVGLTVESRFWRGFVGVGALAQLLLAIEVAERFEHRFSAWAPAVCVTIAWAFSEVLRYRNARTEAGLELDPAFFQPAAFRPNPIALAQAAAVRVESGTPSQRVACTVLYCELTNHSQLADQLPPEACASFLNRLLFISNETAAAHGGRADRLDSEAFRAVFCSAHGVEEHPEAALHAALAIRGRVQTLSQECAVKFGQELDVRMGVSTGEALLADFSQGQAMRPGIAGETPEWARRLAGANVLYGSQILISARTGLLGGHSVERRPIDLLQRYESPRPPEEVFEVLGLQYSLDSAAQTRLRLYKEGVSFFRARKWAFARARLLAARPAERSDEAIELLLQRINEQESLTEYAQG